MKAEDPASRAALGESVGSIDVLVNNAGGGHADEYSMAGFAIVLELNLMTVMDLCPAFTARSPNAGARSSTSARSRHLALKDSPAYTAAKSAVLGLTRTLADKWSRDGIRVNMIAPGFIHCRRGRFIEKGKKRPAGDTPLPANARHA